MLAILFKNNETGEILVKGFVHPGVPVSAEVKKYQRYYDSVFGKDRYTLFVGDDATYYKNGPYGGR